MTDKKLTDKEIVKALEDEIHLAEYVDSDYCSNVNLEIIKFALDIISRHQTEIENLKVENQSFRSAANSLKMHYEEAQAEIEGLKKTEIEIDDFCRRLCRMRMLNGNVIASYEDLQNYIQQEKSEVIKEFAEKLKEKAMQKFDWNEYVEVEDIDNLVKEMVGDSE